MVADVCVVVCLCVRVLLRGFALLVCFFVMCGCMFLCVLHCALLYELRLCVILCD